METHNLARLSGRSIQTARRWIRKKRVSLLHREIGELLVDKKFLCGVWAEWQIEQDYLVDPHGNKFTTGDVLISIIIRQMRRSASNDANYLMIISCL